MILADCGFLHHCSYAGPITLAVMLIALVSDLPRFTNSFSFGSQPFARKQFNGLWSFTRSGTLSLPAAPTPDRETWWNFPSMKDHE